MKEQIQANVQNHSASSQLLIAVEWLILAVLVVIFIVYGFIPGWRTMNTDFPNYFLPAAIHHQGIPIDRAYEWRWFQRYKDHFEIDQPLVGFVPHPPMCAVPLLPLASLPSLEAKRVWLIFGLVLLALSLWLLSRVTQLPLRRLLLLTFLCILPLRDNFLFGQYYAVILFLICLAYYAHCQGHRFTSGAVLAAAGWLKIFPVFFLILFLRKKNWRAVAGLISGGAVLGVVSVLIFGWNVHQVLFTEILPRALHGDLVGPYAPQWNSFTALCHRFFLFEPELNPTPWLDSPTTYGVVQALVATGLLFSFLFFVGDDETPETAAWQWSTFVVLLMLLSSMPSPYHYCVLIFTAIVGIDYLLKKHGWHIALAVAILFTIACYPLPGFALVNLQGRLIAIFLLYLLLLWNAPARMSNPTRRFALVFAAILFVALTFSNLHALKNRSTDFSRRIQTPSIGYGTFSAVKAGDYLLLNEMLPEGYGAVSLPGGSAQPMPPHSDVLAIAAGPQSPFVYFELANRRSEIFRLPTAQIGHADAVPEYVADGEDPAISADGHWFAFLRDDGGGKSSIWLAKEGSAPALVEVPDNLPDVLEMSITPNGNIIAAAGSPADPRLIVLHPNSGTTQPFAGVTGPVRYPAISTDGKRLAFSRRGAGSWHLFLYDLAAGHEQQLTVGSCNATVPSW
jgi:hypothetical protein